MLCAQHVSYQLPDEETRVRHLLNAMTSADPGLLSAVAFAKTSDEHQNDFEKTAACLLPCCPVAAKRAKATGNKRGHSDISALTADISAMDLKKRAGETGVELRWWKLAQAQRNELIKYGNSGLITKPKGANNASRKENQARKKKFKRAVSSAVAKHLKREAKPVRCVRQSKDQAAGN